MHKSLAVMLLSLSAVGCTWVHMTPGASAVRVVSAVGAGDSFVAGFVLAMARGWPVQEALALGTAAASAAVMTPATELCHASDVRHFYSQRIITRL